MKHKIENGDLLRALEIPKKDGTFVQSIRVTYAYLNTQKITIYDTTGLINKIWLKLRQTKSNSSSIGQRYFYYILHDNSIKWIEVGKKINDILSTRYNFSYDSKDHLSIIQEMKESSIGPLPSWDKTHIIQKDSIFSSPEEYNDFILNQQPFYLEDYFNKFNTPDYLNKIRLEWGNIVDEVIQEERDKKIVSILN